MLGFISKKHTLIKTELKESFLIFVLDYWTDNLPLTRHFL